MAQISEIIEYIEQIFPPFVQEEYDNSGFIIGNENDEVKGILLAIDITEDVVQEAIEKKANFIIAHHPIIFKPIKRITGKTHYEKVIISAIKNNISIYGAHTSVDNNSQGINNYLCQKLGLQNIKTMLPKKSLLYKLVTFVPKSHIEIVRNTVFEAGAGHIGNYDLCSYNIEGKGTFRASEKSNPFVGEKGRIHFEDEIRFETIFPVFLKNKIINALQNSHPYEEVAYDIYPLENNFEKFGSGLTGEFPNEIEEKKFLELIKQKFEVKALKHSEFSGKKIKKVAICSGAGYFLTDYAISSGADAFISSEFKYNHYIEVQNKILIVDSGHYETEVFIKNLFYEIITKKFTNFAVEFSEKFKNPVFYF